MVRRARNIQDMTAQMPSYVHLPEQPHWQRSRLLKPQSQKRLRTLPDSTVQSSKCNESLLCSTAEPPPTILWASTYACWPDPLCPPHSLSLSLNPNWWSSYVFHIGSLSSVTILSRTSCIGRKAMVVVVLQLSLLLQTGMEALYRGCRGDSWPNVLCNDLDAFLPRCLDFVFTSLPVVLALGVGFALASRLRGCLGLVSGLRVA